MKREQLQWLIDRRDYRTLYREATHTKYDRVAARLRLVCAAIDTAAVFDREPREDMPRSANAFVQAAHEMLAKPDLATWVLGGVE